MLHTLGTILCIIGIILLSIIAIAILLIILILFVSIRYKVNVIYHNNEYSVTAKFSWLFGVLRDNILFEKDLFENKFTILGIQRKKKSDIKEEKIKKKTKNKVKKISKQNTNKKVVEKHKVDKVDKVDKEEIQTAEFKEQRKDSNINEEKIKRKSFFTRIKEFFFNITGKIQKILAFIKDKDNQEVFIFVKLRVFEILTHIKPKKIKGNISLGFEDPAITGQVLGLIGVAFGFIGRGVRITPDFEHEIMEADILLKGRIRVIFALKIAWKCHRNKKLRKAVQDLSSLND